MKMPELQVSSGQAMLIAGAVAAGIVVLKLLIGEDCTVDRAWGLFLATIAALGLLGGGFLAFQEDEDLVARHREPRRPAAPRAIA